MGLCSREPVLGKTGTGLDLAHGPLLADLPLLLDLKHPGVRGGRKGSWREEARSLEDAGDLAPGVGSGEKIIPRRLMMRWGGGGREGGKGPTLSAAGGKSIFQAVLPCYLGVWAEGN